MLRFTLFVIALLASSVAGATTAILPIDTTAMGNDATRMRLAVVDVAREVLRDRYVAIDEVALNGGVAGCLATAGCLKAAMARVGVDDAALISVHRTGGTDPWAQVTVQMFDAEGVRTFTAAQPLSTTRSNDLKGLLLRAFDPQLSFGRVEFVGVGTDEVWIDNVVAPLTMTLRPGTHTARVLHADGTSTVFSFTVDHDERKQIAVPRASQKVAVVPAVVGAVALAAGVAGVTIGVVRGVDTDTITTVGTIGAGVIGVIGAVVIAVAVSPALSSPEETAR